MRPPTPASQTENPRRGGCRSAGFPGVGVRSKTGRESASSPRFPAGSCALSPQSRESRKELPLSCSPAARGLIRAELSGGRAFGGDTRYAPGSPRHQQPKNDVDMYAKPWNSASHPLLIVGRFLFWAAENFAAAGGCRRRRASNLPGSPPAPGARGPAIARPAAALRPRRAFLRAPFFARFAESVGAPAGTMRA